jgi:prenylcysteine alpha-carboxyl methylesterase
MVLFYTSRPAFQIAYSHFKTWYSSYIVKKDIPYGSKVDTTKLDIYPQNTKSPVIIFYYGGGWVTGSRKLYAPIGSNLQKRGYCVVIPDYTLFPLASVELMLQDIQKSIDFVIKNIDLYGGDPNNITIIGHSAGSHLISTALIKHGLNVFDYLSKKYCPEVISDSELFNAFMNKNPDCDLKPTIQSVKYRTTKDYDKLFHLNVHHEGLSTKHIYKSLLFIKNIVLISGPFDIIDHYAFESERMIEELSVTGRLFGMNEKTFKDYSPTRLLDRQHPSIVFNLLRQYIPKNWLLIHSTGDCVVPIQSSMNFYDALQGTGIQNLELYIDKSDDHAHFIYELMIDKGRIFSIIERFCK